MEHRRKRARGVPKPSTVAIYASVFALIVAVVAIGYQAPQETTGVANASPVNTDTQIQPTSVDQVVATTIAANLAETTNLSVAPNVANFAASTQIKSELSQADDTVISKPQILQPSAESRTIVQYTARAGDTVDGVAGTYSISPDTVRWANNLTGSTIPEGKVLTILPIDGVLYTVKNGDTVESIAAKYGVDQSRLVLFNDLDLGGLTANIKIILPNASLPDTERPGYVAPRSASRGGIVYSNANASAGNKYSFGYCTWYAYNRRAEMGKPIGSYWGNASTWALYASAAGFSVDHNPAYGAIMQNGGGAGHVAVVEGVSANGDVTVTEMNNSAYGGWDIKSTRTITAGQAASYTFIH